MDAAEMIGTISEISGTQGKQGLQIAKLQKSGVRLRRVQKRQDADIQKLRRDFWWGVTLVIVSFGVAQPQALVFLIATGGKLMALYKKVQGEG